MDIHLIVQNLHSLQSRGTMSLYQAVQDIKNIWKKNKRTTKGIVGIQDNTFAKWFSQDELLMGRTLCSVVLILHENLIPRWPGMDKLWENENIKRVQQQQHFNIRQSKVPTSIISRSISSNSKLRWKRYCAGENKQSTTICCSNTNIYFEKKQNTFSSIGRYQWITVNTSI